MTLLHHLTGRDPWSVEGGPIRSSWVYEATQHGPSGSYSRTLDASRVIHVQYSYAPSRPWDGRGPLAASSASERCSPSRRSTPDSRATSTELSGKAVLVRSTSGNWDRGGPAQRDEYMPRRLGANPPPTLHELRGGLAEHVFACCGVLVALLGRSDGTLLREAWRQYIFGAVEPVARIAAHELGRKLDVEGPRVPIRRAPGLGRPGPRAGRRLARSS